MIGRKHTRELTCAPPWRWLGRQISSMGKVVFQGGYIKLVRLYVSIRSAWFCPKGPRAVFLFVVWCIDGGLRKNIGAQVSKHRASKNQNAVICFQGLGFFNKWCVLILCGDSFQNVENTSQEYPYWTSMGFWQHQHPQSHKSRLASLPKTIIPGSRRRAPEAWRFKQMGGFLQWCNPQVIHFS